MTTAEMGTVKLIQFLRPDGRRTDVTTEEFATNHDGPNRPDLVTARVIEAVLRRRQS